MGILADAKDALNSFATLAAKPIFAIAVGTGLAVFLPSGVVTQLGIDSFMAQYRHWVGAVFLISMAYLAAHFLWWLAGRVSKWWEIAEYVRKRNGYLATLTSEEKGYLALFIKDGKTAVNFHYEDGIAGGLRQKKMLYVPTRIGNVLDGHAHSLRDWVRKAVAKDPSILDGATPYRLKRRW
ncbi:hypothetical protein CR3_0988 [Cupriavidus gilardii CR3]|nr:hypothetical protein CR3_0988 [Cupriavidus gilardii CR3]